MNSIAQFDDATAQRILSAVACQPPDLGSEPISDIRGISAALAEYFDVRQAAPEALISPGEVARQALIVLAQDTEKRRFILATALEQPATDSFAPDGGGDPSIALTAAVLFVLRTQLEIERNESGKWSFKLKINSLETSALKTLIEKLVSYMPK